MLLLSSYVYDKTESCMFCDTIFGTCSGSAATFVMHGEVVAASLEIHCFMSSQPFVAGRLT